MEWVLHVMEQFGFTVALVCYVLYENRKREDRYITIIDKQSDTVKSELKDVRGIVSRLEQKILGGWKDV